MNLKHKKFIRLSSLVFSIAAVLISCASNNYQRTVAPLFADEEEPEPELEIHTLSLLNKNHGDCTIVSYGDTQVMIDCGGSKENSKELIYNALKTYVPDGVLDYVVISHGDDDHVSNFAFGGAMDKWLNEEENSITFLIDFDMTRDVSVLGKYTNLPAIINASANYLAFVKEKEVKMKIRHHLSSSMCTYKSRGIDSKSEVFDSWKTVSKLSNKKYITNTYPLWNKSSEVNKIDSITPLKDKFDMSSSNCRLKVLYNYFYDHAVDKGDGPSKVSSVDKNMISTCVMIELDNNNGDPTRALFTGDLEEYDSANGYKSVSALGESTKGGESLLIKHNQNSFKTPITYYKAAHHGSNTSSSPTFLEHIRPLNIAISCCAGGDYGFPSGAIPTAENNMHEVSTVVEMSNYTDHIYITDVVDEEDDSSAVIYYGDINFVANIDGEYDVYFANPLMNKTIIDDEWYINNRLFNVQTFNLTNDTHAAVDCTYIKIGSIDIIIGAGCNDTMYLPGATEITNKINKLCNDRVIDYLIVPTPYISSWAYLLGNNKSYKYVLYGSRIKKVKNFIHYESKNTSGDMDNKYVEFLNNVKGIDSLAIDRTIPTSDIEQTILINGNYKYGFNIEFDGYISPDYYIQFLEYAPGVLITNDGVSPDKPTVSMYTLVNCGTYRYLNMGNDYNYGYSQDMTQNYLIENNPEIEKSIHVLQVPYFGYYSSSETTRNNKFLSGFHKLTGCNKGAHPSSTDKTDISDYIFLNTNFGELEDGKIKYPTGGLVQLTGAVFSSKYVSDNKEMPHNGDFCARVSLLSNRIFYYRFKKTGSLSSDDFFFNYINAERRSEVGKNHKASPVESK